ncbi:MAG: hypothetical protein COT80_01220 [Candidatus Buchananbacteria bacterium CG10_big_fil_rev_8_21_14_0_10_33_19]|uniref:Uncharacterized protein n=1 Tax=Candidatus Buchananbacteria bacterium CG10_big_fil_rev_8_21_14_0_10_33_19 TaxID=1974525 RepID=A0A2H0W4A0_9BACT|nr:MAG: hypothetical protein COT80_01220 [Candidatus Buchananbacteria bacterium CG10_big_fil_rev_8_21_14_0_10_33_19]
MIYLGTALLLIFSLIFFGHSVYLVEYHDEGEKGAGMFVSSIIGLLSGIALVSVLTANSFVGYAASDSQLPINGLCEVLYSDTTTTYIGKEKIEEVIYPTLIKLPDNQFRLFNLKEKIEPGFFKVSNDYNLVPLQRLIEPEIKKTE